MEGTWGEVGVLAPWGVGPAGSRGAASRRRSLAVILVFAVAAAASGATLGLLRQPDPHDQLEAISWTTAAAIASLQKSEQRARTAEQALAAAQARIEELSATGAAREAADVREAERLGIGKFVKTSNNFREGDRERIEAAIVREARRNGLDPIFVSAVIQVESSFDPYAVSGAGAYGLMQLMPPTAQWLMREPDLRAAHLFDPVLNIELGTGYLAQLMKRFDGDVHRALIAYNAGPGVARSIKRGSPAWKRLAVYPKAVLAAYKSLLLPGEQLAAR